MNERKFGLRDITITGICAALIFVVTFLIKIPVPMTVTGAYINLGDTIIYIVAFLINPVFAMLAAAIGSALADVLLGAGVYIVPTFIIKGMMGLFCAMINKNESFGRYLIACLVGGVIMVVGYSSFEAVAFGVSVAIANLPYNLIQFSGTIIIAVVFYKVLPRLKKELS